MQSFLAGWVLCSCLSHFSVPFLSQLYSLGDDGNKKLHVWQLSILFKITPNILIPFWLASRWYLLRAIYYNCKIFFLSGSSYLTVCYGLSGIIFSLIFSPHTWLYWCRISSAILLVIFFSIRHPLQWLLSASYPSDYLLSSYPITFLDHLWIR